MASSTQNRISSSQLEEILRINSKSVELKTIINAKLEEIIEKLDNVETDIKKLDEEIDKTQNSHSSTASGIDFFNQEIRNRLVELSTNVNKIFDLANNDLKTKQIAIQNDASRLIEKNNEIKESFTDLDKNVKATMDKIEKNIRDKIEKTDNKIVLLSVGFSSSVIATIIGLVIKLFL